MEISTTCPGCRTPVLIDAAFARRPVRCGACDRVFVPEPDEPRRPPPSDIETVCSQCRARLEIGAEYAYRPVRCASCGGVFTAFPLQSPAGPRGRGAYRAPPPPSGAMATVSLVCGVVANLFWCIPPFGFVAGLVAVILGWTARTGPRAGHAVVGTVIGAAAVFLATAWTVTIVVILVHHPDLAKNMR